LLYAYLMFYMVLQRKWRVFVYLWRNISRKDMEWECWGNERGVCLFQHNNQYAGYSIFAKQATAVQRPTHIHTLQIRQLW